MVHNGLIGGSQNHTNILAGLSSNEILSLYDADNSRHSPSEVALLTQIHSNDLLPFDIETFEQTFPISDILDTKSDTFPILEESDDGERNFNIRVIPASSGKGSWQHSNQLKKIFIKMDQSIYIHLEYRKLAVDEQLYCRIMMVFPDDICIPVTRCNNHKANNREKREDDAFVESVVRCENSNAKYEGTATGKNVNDRLSVCIPFSINAKGDDDVVKHSIALKFVCQNSCIGRRSTAVIFTLENKNRKVLGKRFINVKICSCPKRDMDKEDSRKKRHADGQPPNKKPAKIAKVKEEPEESGPITPTPKAENVLDEGIAVTLSLPDESLVREVYDFCFAQLAKRKELHPDNPIYAKFLEHFRTRYLASRNDVSS